MTTTLTSKGQVTIPKRIRDALQLVPGCAVEFAVNPAGEVLVRKADPVAPAAKDRYEAARGKADIIWRSDDLMALLRGDD